MSTGISGSKTVFNAITIRSSSRASSVIRSLRRDGLRLAVERRLHRVPGERSALDPYRELAHAGEDRQLSQRPRGCAGGRGRRQEVMEPLEEVLSLVESLSLQALRHHRSRRRRDRAAVPPKGDVLDAVVLHVEIHGERVAAEGVPAAGLVSHVLGSAKVPRGLAVVEDDLLVEVSKLAHLRNTSTHFLRPATSASHSSAVL